MYNVAIRTHVYIHHPPLKSSMKRKLSAGEEVGALSESPLRMEVHGEGEGATEPCRAVVGGDSMTIYFPSGNNMILRRSSR